MLLFVLSALSTRTPCPFRQSAQLAFVRQLLAELGVEQHRLGRDLYPYQAAGLVFQAHRAGGGADRCHRIATAFPGQFDLAVAGAGEINPVAQFAMKIAGEQSRRWCRRQIQEIRRTGLRLALFQRHAGAASCQQGGQCQSSSSTVEIRCAIRCAVQCISNHVVPALRR